MDAMRNWTQRFVDRSRTQTTRETTICFASGVVCGIHLLLWLHQFAISFGASLGVTAGIVVALTLGLSACFPRREVSSEDRSSKIGVPGTFAAVHFGIAVWTLAFSLLLAGAWKMIALVPLGAMTSVVFQSIGATCLATLLLAFPILWITRLPLSFPRSEDGNQQGQMTSSTLGPAGRAFAVHWLGVSVGILFTVLIIAPILGVRTAQLTASCLSCIAALVALAIWYRCGAEGRSSETVVASIPKTRTPLPENEAENAAISAPRAAGWLQTLPTTCVFFCIGALLAGMIRWLHQLVPTSTWLISCEWAFVIAGVVLGWSFSIRRSVKTQHGPAPHMPTFLSLSAWPVLLLLAFPLFIDWSLSTNSRISAIWLIVLSRACLAAAVFLPVGFFCGSLKTASTARSTHHSWFVAGGYLAMQAVLLPVLGLATAFVVIGWAVAASALLESVRLRWLPKPFPVRVLVVTTAFLVVGGWFCRANYSPTRASKLLFDTKVATARQYGVGGELLPFLDEGRCLSVREGQHGTVSVWRYGGAQLQLSESGIPAGIVSEDPRICPEYSAEILPAVIPLVLHEDAQRVLLMGVQGGTTLRTCLTFPIQKIMCVASEKTGYELTKEASQVTDLTGTAQDDRVEWCNVDPILASACIKDGFDVVIGNAGASALSHNGGYYTREYFARAARCLAQNGIFAQRFEFLDYGAEPIQVLSATMRDVFEHVLVFETATGHALVLGTNSEIGLIRSDLVTRAQAPHVRETLSHVGWDWSVLLDIPAYAQDAVDALCQKDRARPAPINSVNNSTLAFDLPIEVMRWGDKQSERRSLLAPYTARLLEWACRGDVAIDVMRRIADMTKQRELQNDHPDRYWVYRKTVKEQILNQPRTQIQLASGEMPSQGLHDEDKRRLSYFEALGKAAKQQQPDAAELTRIATYETPYDPLISYFLHQEVAELWTRSPQRDFATELMHRLHAVYFSVGTDRSVRSVSSALSFLAKHPDAVPNPVQRWDHMNSLLQVMNRRWISRRSTTPKSPDVMLNDIEISIAAMESAFETMDQLTNDTELSENDWSLRQKVLENELIRPLRTYRSKLLPHFHKKRQKEKSRAEAS
jgi:hypothetical protein